MARKIFVSVAIFMVVAGILPSIALSAPTKASPEYLQVLPIFRGADSYIDPYYKARVLAYRMNETMQIDVLVYNQYLANVTIVEVSVRFDWMPAGSYVASNDASRLKPLLLLEEEWAMLSIKVQLPTKPEINKFYHLYDIRVISSWRTGEKVVGRLIDSGLAVYSPEQIQAVELYEKLSQRLGLQPLSVFRSPSPPPSFTTSEATALVRQASAMTMDGLGEYEKGEFSKAAGTFTTALKLYENALASEAEISKVLEEVTMKQVSAQAEQAKAQTEQAKAQAAQADALNQQAKAFSEQATAMDKQANALATFGYGLSVGTILIGIGVIIFALRSGRRTPAR